MNADYLPRLDALTEAGVDGLGDKFRKKRFEYVASRQMPDGGFAGRVPGSDIYYTDFGVRAAALLDPRCEVLTGVHQYMTRLDTPPRNVVECFNRLNIIRVLDRFERDTDIGTDDIAAALPADPAGLYEIFLTTLCHEMLGSDAPDTAQRVSGLRRTNGGFSDLVDDDTAQTNATAAAVAVLDMQNALDEQTADAAAGFLRAAQHATGGFLAHPDAPEPDLLSTFTALVTLAWLDRLGDADTAAAGRFLRSLAAKNGGFRSSPSDKELDVEYAYYGVATAALLRRHANESG
jgi:geranylgeranyl transferase type-2 subunit beta